MIVQVGSWELTLGYLQDSFCLARLIFHISKRKCASSIFILIFITVFNVVKSPLNDRHFIKLGGDWTKWGLNSVEYGINWIKDVYQKYGDHYFVYLHNMPINCSFRLRRGSKKLVSTVLCSVGYIKIIYFRF